MRHRAYFSIVKAMRSSAHIIETFHLAFLSALPAKIGRDRFVLKGGANLRYFFGSPRYSEDIDIDAEASLARQLEPKIDAVLTSPQLVLLLRAGGIHVDLEATTKPKQTATTRRWKIALALSESRETVRTKIEFSARNGDGRHAVDAIPRRVVAPYGLAQPLVPHYLGPAAVDQKIRALAGRSEVQARDVFDLELLLRFAPITATVDPRTRREAAGRALELDYRAFSDQILPFLEPSAVPLYDPQAWEQVQVTVSEALLAGDHADR